MSFSNPPKFFKVIQNHELQYGELRVPKKFVQNFWKGIKNPVLLRLPNSNQQEVFWIEHNGDVWFQKNWGKLAKFLKYGYVVVFKYIGGACFKVEIFGQNTLEINYNSIKFIDEVVSDDETRKEVFEVSDDKRKVDMDYDATYQNISSSSTRGRMNKRMNKKARRCTTGETNVAGTSQRRKSDTNIGGVSKKAKNNNPSFEITLTQTYARGYFFRIPREFSKKYMKGFEGAAMLKVGDREDRIWNVVVRCDPEKENSIMNSGWINFSMENNLQIGDVCKFEMIHSRPFSFSVTIIRARQEPNCKKLQDSKESNVIKHKTFKIFVNSLSYPYVPNNVLSSHDDCHGKSAELKVDGKSWFVKLNCQNGKRFYKGWRKFKKDCKLENGDTCFLELIDETKLVFKVSFKRKNQ